MQVKQKLWGFVPPKKMDLPIFCFIWAYLASIILALKFIRFQTSFKGGRAKVSAKGSVSRRAGLPAGSGAGGGGGGEDDEVQRHERSFDQGASVTMILQLFGSILILAIIMVVIMVVMLMLRRQHQWPIKVWVTIRRRGWECWSPQQGAKICIDYDDNMMTITVMIIFKILRNFVSTSRPTSRWSGLRKRQRLVKLSSSRWSSCLIEEHFGCVDAGSDLKGSRGLGNFFLWLFCLGTKVGWRRRQG